MSEKPKDSADIVRTIRATADGCFMVPEREAIALVDEHLRDIAEERDAAGAQCADAERELNKAFERIEGLRETVKELEDAIRGALDWHDKAHRSPRPDAMRLVRPASGRPPASGGGVEPMSFRFERVRGYLPPHGFGVTTKGGSLGSTVGDPRRVMFREVTVYLWWGLSLRFDWRD